MHEIWNASDKSFIDISIFLVAMKSKVFDAITHQAEKYKGNSIKWYICVIIEMKRCIKGKPTVNVLHSSTRYAVSVLKINQINSTQASNKKINDPFERFIQKGSRQNVTIPIRQVIA